MSVLPSGWDSVNLFEICRPRQWKTISTRDLLPSGYIVYGANGEIGFYSEYTHEKPTVMITCRGATCGNIHISKPFSYINGNAMALDDLNESISGLRYVYYFLRSRGFEDVISGSAQPQITGEGLRKASISIAPLPEQKRIADKLDVVLARVDACRDRLDRIPTILKRFRQSVLANATFGNLTKEWRISYSEGSGQYLSSEIYNELPDLPSSWRYEKLGKLLLGLKYGTSQKCEYEKKGKPVFRIPNIGDGVLIDDNMKYAELPEKEYQQLALQEGDILMIRSNGSVSLVGKTALVSSDFIGYAYAGYLIRLRPNEEVQSDYLNYVLASMWLRQQIEIPARSTSGINNINSEEVRNLLIPLPPVDEQTEIVRRVEALFACADRLEARYAGARTQVEKLTPATLAKAFRGELVPQNPNDEPASMLLDRIKAQQSVQPAKKPKRVHKVAA